MSTVSQNALVRRINRVLSKRGDCLHATRGERARPELGDHYIVDVYRNSIVTQHVDLEQLARELGVLRAGETVRGEA